MQLNFGDKQDSGMIDPGSLIASQILEKIGKVLKRAFTEPVTMPRPIWYIRSAFRIAGLLIVSFIIFIWPADGYEPENYETWASRIAMIPEPMWTVIYIIVFLWSASEIMAVGQYRNGKKQTRKDDVMNRIDTNDGDTHDEL